MPLSNLDRIQKNAALAKLINELPPTAEMARFLECADLTADEQRMARKRKLTDIRGGSVDPSAWQILRWIVASNSELRCCSLVRQFDTCCVASYIREITEEDMLVQGIPKGYRQFQFISGAPEKEAVLRKEIEKHQATDKNMIKYPTLYAFHGSRVCNWDSILRTGM